MKRIFLLLLVSILISCSSTSKTTSSSSSSKLVISPAALTLIDVIVGKFPGVRVIGSNTTSTPKIIIRGGSMSINTQAYAVYDVDGILYTDCPTFIDPQQIKSITILRSLAATNRYGGVARGGAIVIRLKANN
jgi:hypothetical protein